MVGFFKNHNKNIECFKITNIEESLLNQIVDDCLDEMVGKKYDYLSAIGIFVVWIIKKTFRKDIKNFLGSSKTHFCSEFMLKISEAIEEKTSIRIYDGEYEKTTPQDLYEQSLNNDYLEKIS